MTDDRSLSFALREHIETQVAGGYADRDEIIERTVEMAMDHEDADGETLDEAAISTAVTAAVDAALRVLAERQAGWPAVTDNDRLTAAFAELERAGIVARENFTCCNSCGFAEIGDEIDPLEDPDAPEPDDGVEPVPARGFTFFHEQATESAIVHGDGVYLNYGHVDGGVEDAVGIGHEIVETLRRNGLRPEWNGQPNKKIKVPLEWQRRPGAPARSWSPAAG